MTSLSRLALEAVVVGVVCAALFAVFHAGHMLYMSRPLSLPPSSTSAKAAAAAAAFHVGAEFLGVNAWYCKNR